MLELCVVDSATGKPAGSPYQKEHSSKTGIAPMIELPDRFRPLRLDAAARVYFGSDSGVTGRSLSRLARRGELSAYRIAGKLYTTLADIEQMVTRSTVERPSQTQPQPAPDFAPPAFTDAAVARAELAIQQLRDR
jgi:hypothetical protein